MTKQIITQGGKPAFVVIPIDEWRRIESTLEDRVDAAAVRAFLKNPSETIPDSVLAAILNGSHPIKAFREHRGIDWLAMLSAVKQTLAHERRQHADHAARRVSAS